MWKIAMLICHFTTQINNIELHIKVLYMLSSIMLEYLNIPYQSKVELLVQYTLHAIWSNGVIWTIFLTFKKFLFTCNFTILVIMIQLSPTEKILARIFSWILAHMHLTWSGKYLARSSFQLSYMVLDLASTDIRQEFGTLLVKSCYTMNDTYKIS